MIDLTCARGVELLMEYLEGVIPAGTKAAIDGHLAGCPRCTAFVASYRETPRILRDATTTELPAEAKRLLASFLRRLPGRSETE